MIITGLATILMLFQMRYQHIPDLSFITIPVHRLFDKFFGSANAKVAITEIIGNGKKDETGINYFLSTGDYFLELSIFSEAVRSSQHSNYILKLFIR